MNLLNQHDPIKRQGEKIASGELSPMDPPDAYAPPSADAIPYEDLHPYLQGYFDEHRRYEEKLTAFEDALLKMQEGEFNQAVDTTIKEFFRFFDEEIVPHGQREDHDVFPQLRTELLARGEHSQTGEPTTAVDVMEADHVSGLQTAAVAFNMFALASRLPDARSQVIAYDVAIEQGKSLVEHFRLHFFREEQILFPLVQKYVAATELDALQAQMHASEKTACACP